MPRDVNRIPRILALLRTAWEKYPNLRLCQLIGNLSIDCEKDMYYVEDTDIEICLKAFLEEHR
jgi:uncharacterized protein YihD (DUF1040 family)